jgi:hypothetical protein
MVPLEGVIVSVYNNAQISPVTTKSDGTFIMKGLPKADTFVLSMNKAGYVPTLRLSYTYEVQTSVTATVMYTEDAMAVEAASVGATYPDPNSGFMTFFGTKSANGTLALLDSFSVKLDPSPSGAKGPYYLNESLVLDTARTNASAWGAGAYFNVPPGNYKMTFSHPSLKCGDPVSVLVVAGYVSANVPAYCQ